MNTPEGSRLAADCVQTLRSWQAPNADQDALRTAFLSHLREHPDGWSRSCPGAHLTASSLVASPDLGKVVLVLHKRLGRWLQPGGHLEADDDTLLEASLREASEETGLSSLQIRPLPLHLDRHEVPCGPVRPAYHLDVRYLIVADPDEAPHCSTESEQVRWFDAAALPKLDSSLEGLLAAGRSWCGSAD